MNILANSKNTCSNQVIMNAPVKTIGAVQPVKVKYQLANKHVVKSPTFSE